MAARVLGPLTGAQMFLHAIVHRGRTDTVTESALKVDWEKNPLPAPGNRTCLNGLPVRRSTRLIELHPCPFRRADIRRWPWHPTYSKRYNRSLEPPSTLPSLVPAYGDGLRPACLTFVLCLQRKKKEKEKKKERQTHRKTKRMPCLFSHSPWYIFSLYFCCAILSHFLGSPSPWHNHVWLVGR